MTLICKVNIASNFRAIDIGANRGIYTYQFWKRNYIVESFEPIPEISDWIRSWAHGKDNITVYNTALSNVNALSEFYIPCDYIHSHDALASLNIKSGEYQAIKVETKKLDSYSFSNVAYIKIDVEGHERLTIEGARNTILTNHPLLIVEIEQRHQQDFTFNDVIEYVINMGYECMFIENEIIKPFSEYTLEVMQSPILDVNSREYINNFIFIPSFKMNFKLYGLKVASLDAKNILNKIINHH
jgi:FkbM family methyltransferase